jgi:hypothetical protein|tara:strand:+ start:4268 stop:4915 length:648 start_codon:yes stop_codon:yes gene_type:complete
MKSISLSKYGEYKMNNQALINAMIKATENLNHIVNDSSNPFFKSKYASLKQVLDTVKQPYAEQGIHIQQISHESDTGAVVETVFFGHGGELSTGKVHMPSPKTDPQAFGSALSYAKRYSLQMACGLATVEEDDDAEKATVTFEFKDAEGKVLVEERDPTKYIKELGKYLPADNPDTDAQNLYEVNAKAIHEAKQLTKVVKFQEAYDRLIEVYEQA